MVQARTRIMNPLQAVALNEGVRCKKQRRDRVHLERRRRLQALMEDTSERRMIKHSLLVSEGGTVPPFLPRAHTQSGFHRGLRRMQCDRQAGVSYGGLTLLACLETGFGISHKPFLDHDGRAELSSLSEGCRIAARHERGSPIRYRNIDYFFGFASSFSSVACC
jgi:hypothetical protein